MVCYTTLCSVERSQGKRHYKGNNIICKAEGRESLAKDLRVNVAGMGMCISVRRTGVCWDRRLLPRQVAPGWRWGLNAMCWRVMTTCWVYYYSVHPRNSMVLKTPKQGRYPDTVSLLFTSERPECLDNLPHGTEVRFKPILVWLRCPLLFAHRATEPGLYSEGYREPLKIFQAIKW